MDWEKIFTTPKKEWVVQNLPENAYNSIRKGAKKLLTK